MSKSPPLAPRKNPVSYSSSLANDRSCNIILFGLPEGSSLVESKKVVDEILEFISGKPIQIKDMFRSSKYVPSTTSASRPRPIPIEPCTAWDRKLVLLRKSSLKHFCLKRLFLREDVSPDHKLRARKSTSSANSTQGSFVFATSHTPSGSSTLASKHSSSGHPPNVMSRPETLCDNSSETTDQLPEAGSSLHSSHSTSTTSATDVQESLKVSHGSA